MTTFEEQLRAWFPQPTPQHVHATVSSGKIALLTITSQTGETATYSVQGSTVTPLADYSPTPAKEAP